MNQLDQALAFMQERLDGNAVGGEKVVKVYPDHLRRALAAIDDLRAQLADMTKRRDYAVKVSEDHRSEAELRAFHLGHIVTEYGAALREIVESQPASGGGWAGAERSLIGIAQKALDACGHVYDVEVAR